MALLGGGYPIFGMNLLSSNEQRRPSAHATYSVAVGRFIRGEIKQASECIDRLMNAGAPSYLSPEIEKLQADIRSGALPPQPDLKNPRSGSDFGIAVDELIEGLVRSGARPALHPLVKHVQNAVERRPTSPLRYADPEIRSALRQRAEGLGPSAEERAKARQERSSRKEIAQIKSLEKRADAIRNDNRVRRKEKKINKLREEAMKTMKRRRRSIEIFAYNSLRKDIITESVAERRANRAQETRRWENSVDQALRRFRLPDYTGK